MCVCVCACAFVCEEVRVCVVGRTGMFQVFSFVCCYEVGLFVEISNSVSEGKRQHAADATSLFATACQDRSSSMIQQARLCGWPRQLSCTSNCVVMQTLLG